MGLKAGRQSGARTRQERSFAQHSRRSTQRRQNYGSVVPTSRGPPLPRATGLQRLVAPPAPPLPSFQAAAPPPRSWTAGDPAATQGRCETKLKGRRHRKQFHSNCKAGSLGCRKVTRITKAGLFIEDAGAAWRPSDLQRASSGATEASSAADPDAAAPAA